MVLWQNSEALTALGRTAEAKHAAANAVSIAERVGRRGWTATALRSIGIAYEATGDLPTAEDAFRRFAPQEHASAAVFVLGTCATCPRTGGHGRLEEAATHVDRALAMGPPLGQFEARVARCVLAVVRRQPNTSEMLQDAVHRATAGSHRASQARLSMLIDSWEAVSSTATHGDR